MNSLRPREDVSALMTKKRRYSFSDQKKKKCIPYKYHIFLFILSKNIVILLGQKISLLLTKKYCEWHWA